MTHAIFIKSFPGDAEWLSYALRSIRKYAKGFTEVVIAVPEGMAVATQGIERVVHVGDHAKPYLYQQLVKLNADLYTACDWIRFCDSDTIFNREYVAGEDIHDGKARWMITPIEKAGSDAAAAWVPVMSRFYGFTPRYEFMRRMGQTVPRWALGCFRDYCQRWHGKSMQEYILEQDAMSFSEFNVLGMYLHGNHPHSFNWWNTEELGVPNDPMSQFWSHGGITNEIRETLEKAVA